MVPGLPDPSDSAESGKPRLAEIDGILAHPIAHTNLSDPANQQPKESV